MTAGLVVRDVTVRFGGLVAVDGLSLDAPLGTITGLMGPNGAGKTTTFNVCSGLTRAASGTIRFRDDDITHDDVSARARRGLGRTFQQTQLFTSMTVAENVALGHEAGLAGSNPLRHVVARRSDTAAVHEAARDAMALCGIEHLAEVAASALPTGTRRLVELARALAGNFELLLLDEPSAGLDADESRHFGEILGRVVAERGTGLLLVEHDVHLVLGLSARVYVLDFGTLLFEGTPADVRASTVVQNAYLGRRLDDSA